MQQFNPIDAALLFLESPNTPFHVSTVCIYDRSTCPGKAPDYNDIVEAVRSCLPLAPAFRRRIVRVPMDIGHPYWVEDENFDLEYHMQHIALPAPGTWEQFRTQVGRLIARPLNLSRSPWEMIVIDGLDGMEGYPEGCFATVLKVHHCAIDGKTGVSIINALHQTSADAGLKQIDDDWVPETPPSTRKLLRRGIIQSLRSPFAIARPVIANARSLVKTALADHSKDDPASDLTAPPTILNGRISSRRVFDDVRCPLDDIKALRKTVDGATINDACLCVVAEALRRYLDSKGELPSESLVTVVPISTRIPEEIDAPGNQIAITRVAMGTDIEDPIARLRSIVAQTSKKKAMQDGVLMSVMLKVVHNLPGALIGAAARAIPLVVANANSFSNTMVTNVPGPPMPLYLLGAEAIHMFGTPPLMDGGCVLHSVGSYKGEFIFSFIACPEKMPDYDFYRQCLSDAIDDITKLAA